MGKIDFTIVSAGQRTVKFSGIHTLS